jgi:glycosyltransferase involved in cell wall biosynthesis
MACEVPVISSNAGGIPELNIQGVTGFLSPIGDTEDMARKALFVLDKNNLPTFKANAVARAKEFDISNILPKYEEYYSMIIDKVTSKALI